jgi:hypothetical protein
MKKYLYIGLVLIVIYAVIQTYRTKRLKSKLETAITEKGQAIDLITGELANKVKIYEGKLGEHVAQVEASELSKKNLEALLKSEQLKYWRSFKSKTKHTESIGSIEFVSEPFKEIVHDTVYLLGGCNVFAYNYHDEYNNIVANVIDTPLFQMRVPVYIKDNSYRKRFLGIGLGRRIYDREAYTPNKLVSLDSIVFIKTSK